jgi:type II secretory pathway component GspD/PulD (secretin)
VHFEANSGPSSRSGIAQSVANAEPDAVAVSDKEDKVGRELKIFSLQNADAEALTQTVLPLFVNVEKPPTVIVFDERTNTIIARGPESELQILEAVLLRLDETPAQKTTN